MSVQACRIKGYGHILKEDELPPRFNKIKNDCLSEFWDESDIGKDYWFFARHNGKNRYGQLVSPIGACFNYMSGDSYFVGIITEAIYIECSDENWGRVIFRDDDYVKTYADDRIRYVFGIEKKAQKVEFEIYQ